MPHWWVFVLIGFPLLLVLLFNVNFQNLINGHGRVLDFKTRRPVADAEVIAVCSRNNWLHGSRMLKTLRERSGVDGGFRFSFFETWHCTYLSGDAVKPGFTGIHMAEIPNVFARSGYSTVPFVIWMVNDKDLVSLRVADLLADSSPELTSGSRRLYVDEFTWAVDRFMRAKSIATTADQNIWISQKFCPQLSRQFAAIPAPDRTGIASPEIQSRVSYWRSNCHVGSSG